MSASILSDTRSWSLLVGIALPLLIAVVNQPGWSRRVRQVVAVIAAVIGGLLTCLATGAFADGPVTVIGAVATVLVASQAVYGRLFVQTTAKVEQITSRRGRHAAPEHEEQQAA